ncbi:MAG: M1 family aminopeptidase [Candidatus Kapabacteria bacterium]|nr:M1 family aminopeptidase [Candidatus Kapabacteria bacterium]
MKILYLLCLLIFGLRFSALACPLILNDSASLPSTATNYIPQDFDVLSYNAILDFTKNKLSDKKLNASVCTIKFNWINNKTKAKFYFHLQGLLVDSVLNEFRNKILFQKDTTLTGETIYSVNRSEMQNDTNNLHVYYSGNMTTEAGKSPWGGVSFDDNVLYALGVGFRNDYVSTTRHWLPCYDHPSDKALFSILLMIDDSLNCVSNGIKSKENIQNKIKYEVWTSKFPMATYLATFAIGKFSKIEYTKDSLPIEVYTQKKDSIATAYNFSRLPEMVSFFSSTFTPYPFEKVGYVNTELGSMEHQTMISYANSLNKKALSNQTNVNETAAHELAHQWFGDMLSPLDFRDAWLNESFATYCESLWIEHILGKKYYLNNQRDKLNRYLNTINGIDGPISLYNFDKKICKSNYPETIYQKGAVVLGMLRYLIGDDNFFQAIREYLNKYKYGNVTTAQLLEILNPYIDKAENRFTLDWIYRNEIPMFNVELKQSKDSLNITQYMANDTVTPFKNVPLEFDFNYANGDMKTQVIFYKDNGNYKLNVPNDFTSMQFNGAKEVVCLAKVVSITGIEDNVNQTSNISILEQPVKDKLKIKYNFSNGKAKLNVYTLNGNTLFTKDILSIDGDNLIEYDFQNFSSGAYFLSIKQNENIETIEFIKE